MSLKFIVSLTNLTRAVTNDIAVVAATAQRHDPDRGVAVWPVDPWPTTKFGWVGPATVESAPSITGLHVLHFTVLN